MQEIQLYLCFLISIRERTTNTSSHEVNIQGLKPGTEYEFRVVTVNRDGPSVTPTVLPIRTKREGEKADGKLEKWIKCKFSDN